MKVILVFFLFAITCISANAQKPLDIESALKYPDELLFDKSLMNYTVYKPNTSIACTYRIRQVSKTTQRTVFHSDEDSIKMSFAFFSPEKLPFYNSSDSAFDLAYKFYAWDSSARAKANGPAISIVREEKAKGMLYYKEVSGDITKLYLAGVKNGLLSLILFSSKDMKQDSHFGNMEMSFKLNSRN